MATLAVAAGGAVLGGVAGGLVPGVGILLGAQLGFLGGAVLGNILFPTEIDAGGPSRDDVRLSSAATGRFIPVPYGVVRVAGQYIWVDEPFFQTSTQRPGKGGPEIKTTKMFLTFAVGICEGPIAAVTRIWMDDTLVFDISANNTDGPSLSQMILTGEGLPVSTSFEAGTQSVSLQQFGPIRIHLGLDGQPPDPAMQVDERIGAAFGGETADFVPPMNGLAWAMFERIGGEAANNHFPQVEFEVLTEATAVTAAQQFDPVPCFDMGHPLSDWSTQVCVSGDTDSGAIYSWNTGDKNPDDPLVTAYTDRDGNQPPGHSAKDMLLPNNIGTWDDPDLNVIGISGAGNSILVTYSLKTGTQTNVANRTISIGAAQPVSAIYWPDTFAPSHAVLVYETSDRITTVPLALPEGVDSTRPELNDPPIPGTGIATASFPGDPGFIGPDGLLYMIVGETNDSELVIVAFDVLTLDIRRVLKPYRTSPETDDPFYTSCRMTYDRQHDKIILLSAVGFARKVDRATLAIDPEPDLALGITFVGGVNEASIKRGPYGGRLWLTDGLGNAYHEIDLVSMTLTDRSFSDADDTYGLVTLQNHTPAFDPLNNGIWVRARFIDWLGFMSLDRQSPLCPTAADIAADISDRCEIDATLRETALWGADTICGYLIGRRIAGRKALEPIAGAIDGDFRTQDGKVQFFKLDGASVKSVPEDDLGAAETIDAKVPGRNISWPYERELPARVDVQFVDRRMDYSSNTEGYDRPLEGFKGRGKETVQMPIVFDDDSSPTPIEIAERLLYQFDANRRMHLLALTWEHLDLNVGDAFQYSRGGFTYTVRAEKWSLAENNKILIEAKSEDVSLNTASGDAGNAGSVVFTPPLLQGTAGSEAFLIDSSLLRDFDDSATGIPIYVGAAPIGSAAWPGANLLRSADGGATWDVIATHDSGQGLDWGVAATTLGDARLGVIDRTNTLTVSMRRGTLGSVANSDLDEDRSLNALLVGRPGRWEVVRFAEAVNATGSPDASGDVYTLSQLRRGQRGTNLNTANHQVGDLVIVLDPAKLERVVLETAELNVARLYRLVTIGQPESLVSAQSFTLSGESKKPYTLTDVRGSRNGATGDWTVEATRRTRVGGAWVDFTEPPVGEESEAYELEVLAGSGGSVVLTKTGLTSPSITLTTAELHTAGLGSGSPDSDAQSPFSLTVKWYQVSATVGRGNSEEITLTAPTPGYP